ncbi:MAG: GerMN domain-containing protein [Lachnospiraceae bacterium]|nr:GerMN domain-containing protein [Lachnospiraceae bacterium]MDD7378325.1 GerMN domain-containing protein [Lachnospiraceae bacterium]MDY4617599.1 GerMN domain-containing protein [Lachnospiraceae bacterium]
MKKKRLWILLLAAVVLVLGGCKSEKEEADGYQIYYLNAEQTKISGKAYDTKETDTEKLVAEFLKALAKDPEDVDYRKPIPNEVELLKTKLEGNQLSIWFDTDYYNMDAASEVLCRAAIVRTVTQIPDVNCVSIFIGDSPLVDAKNNVVGLMTAESFVENPKEQINSLQEATITLYFSNKNGDGLVTEKRDVHYSSNISMEKLIVEQLLKGPEKKDAKSAIPSGTKLVSVSAVDGVCYVNFDEGFTNQDYEIQEPIVIYSIVNSLSELSTVSKVQISVNGSTKGVYRDSYKLDKVYERNLDYVKTSKE